MKELCGTVSALHSLQDDYELVRPVNTDKKAAYKEHTHTNAVEILFPENAVHDARWQGYPGKAAIQHTNVR